LNLGDGYALHGTDNPASIGQSVSHGCVRLRNEDIETLYRIVPVVLLSTSTEWLAFGPESKFRVGSSQHTDGLGPPSRSGP
jgi:hypothetical protein